MKFDNQQLISRVTEELLRNGSTIPSDQITSLINKRDQLVDRNGIDPQTALYEAGKAEKIPRKILDVIDAAEYEYLVEIGATQPVVLPNGQANSPLKTFLKEVGIVLLVFGATVLLVLIGLTLKVNQ